MGGLFKSPKVNIPQQPIVAPTPAVEEASVEMEDEDKKKRLSSGKGTLKTLIRTSAGTGLNLLGGKEK